jgi:methionyl-tRNA synthetase
MIDRYVAGRVPTGPSEDETTDSERALHETQRVAFEQFAQAIDEIAPHDALKAGWAFVRKANAYVEEVAPWALAKDDAKRRRLEIVLYELADALRLLAIMVAPITPRAAQELWTRLGLSGTVEGRTLDEDGHWGLIPAGSAVSTGPPLFPRVETEQPEHTRRA